MIYNATKYFEIKHYKKLKLQNSPIVNNLNKKDWDDRNVLQDSV